METVPFLPLDSAKEESRLELNFDPKPENHAFENTIVVEKINFQPLFLITL